MDDIHEHPEHNPIDEIESIEKMEAMPVADTVETVPFGVAASENSEEYLDQERYAGLIDENLKNELKLIPEKMGFKIGEVADMLGIKSYVLRYWETEFEALRPKKSNQNQRMYTRKDVETALLVRKLLHRDRFSIEGARKALKMLKTQVKKERTIDAVNENFLFVGEGLRELLDDVRALKQKFIND